MVGITNMNQDVRAELDRYVSLISQMDGVIQVYLFGSYAYGLPSEDSDIDLMVVVKDGIEPIKMMRDVSHGLHNKKIPLDVLVINNSDFIERSKPDRVTLQREVKDKGVLVYGEQRLS